MDLVEASSAPDAAVDGPATEPPPDPGAAPAAGPGAVGRLLSARVLLAAAVVVVAAGVVLRFRTTSSLWLDEALTVNIAGQPLSHLQGLLRRDGAPPLFYVLLHVWMGLFGSSDVAVRVLPGLFSTATIPLVWGAGRRLGGRTVAASAVLLVASSPFAVRYGTEARMYSLVALLVVAGVLSMGRVLDRPRPGNLVALGACTGLLLYTHYWSFYLVGMTGLWLVWQSRWGPAGRRPAARLALVAVVVGSLTFLPWIPTFLYQSAHTGTPWAVPANFAAMVDAISSFAGGATNQGRVLALVYFALAGLGLFGVARGAFHIDLDLRTLPRSRGLAIALVGTLAAAIVGGYVSRSTFQPRYSMVVFVPLVLLVALGISAFADRRIRVGVLAVAVVCGLAGGIADITGQRTQAPLVAAALAQLGRPGDVVAYCPDQLGPDVSRVLPGGRYQQITFPRGTGPAFVDWVDYAQASAEGNPAGFARRLEGLAAGGHQIWLVWAPGYQTFGTKCESLERVLLADGGFGAHEQVVPNPKIYFEPEELVRFAPVSP